MTHRPLPAGDRAEERSPRALGPVAARIVAIALVATMIVGALFMWIGVPVVWLWLASQLASTSQPNAALYAFAGVGILLSMAGMGWVLSRLNRVYVTVTGASRGAYVRHGWERAEHGEHESDPAPGVLDSIVVISVVIALIVLAVWFFFFAGSMIDYKN